MRGGRRRLTVLAALVVFAFPPAACSEDEPAPVVTPRGDQALTVGGGRSTEMLVLQSLYGQLLTKAGYKVDYKAADRREVYAAALESGEIDVVPEYAATSAEYWNQLENGSDAEAVAGSDANGTVRAMRTLLKDRGLTVLDPTRAVDQNGYVVTRAFAQKNSLVSLSQLGALKQPLVLAATPECAQRPFCSPGLKRSYALDITKVLPLGLGTPETKQAVLDGTADLGLVGTTDGTLDSLGLVLLQDDKRLQLADNVVPVLNTLAAGTPKVAATLNVLAPVLTTSDLAELTAAVDVKGLDPVAVSKQYLQEKKLL